MAKVYFIGFGPGDPELLTLKALKAIKSSQVIIYPGSLISQEMLEFLKRENKEAEFVDAFGKKLEEICQIIKEAYFSGKTVSRLVSGDPSIFSSLMEHLEILRIEGIPYEIIPGISSALMAGARLSLEFTYPEISNSIIFTRLEGKTGGATEEEILKFCETKSTLVFFLSSGLSKKLEDLLKKALSPETKVAILYKLSRPEEKSILTTLDKLSETMEREGISKTALIVVGKVLELIDKNFYKRSYLYGKE